MSTKRKKLTSRQRFERMIKRLYHSCSLEQCGTSYGSREYQQYETALLWEGWQAAMRSKHGR